MYEGKLKLAGHTAQQMMARHNLRHLSGSYVWGLGRAGFMVEVKVWLEGAE